MDGSCAFFICKDLKMSSSQAQRGIQMDDESFARLIQTLMPSLYRMCQGVLRQEADAQDAVQQALLNAWKARERVRSGSEKAWLMRIAMNACRDIQRQRRRVAPMADVPERPAYTPVDTGLREAVDALPEKLRIPLLLHCMEGLTMAETARTLGILESTCKGRIYRARRALEKALHEEVELE